jgi:truncated hemoglobin YjbI
MVKDFILAICLLTVIGGSAMAGSRNHKPVNLATGQATIAGQEQKSLYSRLGGYDAVAAVVDDFIGRLVADKRFAKFFVGHSEDSLKKIRQHIVDQFCSAAGGPCLYIGRDMKTSHKGLGITEDLPKAEKDDLLAFVTSLKKDIVEK